MKGKIRLWDYHFVFVCLLGLLYPRLQLWNQPTNVQDSWQKHYATTGKYLIVKMFWNLEQRAKARNSDVGTTLATLTRGSENDTGLWQGCTNPERQTARATKLNLVASIICRFSVWNLLRGTFLGSEILRWFLDFWKISAHLAYGNILEENEITLWWTETDGRQSVEAYFRSSSRNSRGQMMKP